MRLTLFSLLLVFVISLNGQSDNKGKFYLSGNSLFEYTNNFRNTFKEARFESSHLGYFLTNRLLIGAEIIAGTDEDLYDNSPFIISPFVRYYLPINQGKQTQYFAEINLGIFGNFGFGSSYETDFYLGLGAERNFDDGLVGTARLGYQANASGLNYTELDLGLNFILGGKQSIEDFAGRRRGSLLIDPQFGSIGFGYRSRGNLQDLQIDLNLGLGYFLTEHLLIEAGAGVITTSTSIDPISSFQASASTNWQVYAGLRYFLPSATGRLQPYLMARATRTGSSDRLELSGFTPQITNDSGTLGEAGGGTLYYLSSKAALDFNVRYQKRLDLRADAGHTIGGSLGMKVFFNKN